MSDSADTTSGPTVRTATARSGAASALVAAALVGAAAGVAAKAADASTWRWAADLGTYPALWLLAVALIGRLAPSTTSAALRAAVFFAAMTLTYYAWAQVVLGFGPGVWTLALGWWAASATAVPAYAVVVRVAALARPGAHVRLTEVAAGLVLALAGGLALQDGALVQLARALVEPGPAHVPLRPVQAVASVGAAVVITGVLPAHRTRRAWAVALLPLAAVVATVALDWAYSHQLLPG